MCGSGYPGTPACSSYLSGASLPATFNLINSAYTWTFTLVPGLNNLTISSPTTSFDIGSMLLLKLLDTNVKIKMVPVGLHADFVYNAGVVQSMNAQNTLFYRLCVKVITTRYIYVVTNGVFQTLPFSNYSGNRTLSLNFYDKYQNLYSLGSVVYTFFAAGGNLLVYTVFKLI